MCFLVEVWSGPFLFFAPNGFFWRLKLLCCWWDLNALLFIMTQGVLPTGTPKPAITHLVEKLIPPTCKKIKGVGKVKVVVPVEMSPHKFMNHLVLYVRFDCLNVEY